MVVLTMCVAAISATGTTLVAAAEHELKPNRSTTHAERLPSAVAQLLDRVLERRDNHGMPFAIVDKQNARVHVFAANGSLAASSPVLLGLANGDDSVEGIGERKMAAIKPFERTTPAGRFEAEAGRNAHGEDIIWVDYDAAVSMHRVRTANKSERRLERLATPTTADNRISYGCINVPATFYNAHLRDTLGTEGGVVYVLPETRTLQSQFRTLFGVRNP